MGPCVPSPLARTPAQREGRPCGEGPQVTRAPAVGRGPVARAGLGWAGAQRLLAGPGVRCSVGDKAPQPSPSLTACHVALLPEKPDQTLWQ